MDKMNISAAAPPDISRFQGPASGESVANSVRQIAADAKPTDKAAAEESAYAAVEKFKTLVQELDRKLDFSVDEASGQFVVKVMDSESGTLIRQIPSEDLLRLSERLEDMRSLLFKAEA